MTLIAVTCWLTWSAAPVPASSDAPTGAMSWICAAYGALAGASIATGSLIGALGATLSAARAGCFG
jgi:hypothetical protein